MTVSPSAEDLNSKYQSLISKINKKTNFDKEQNTNGKNSDCENSGEDPSETSADDALKKLYDSSV